MEFIDLVKFAISRALKWYINSERPKRQKSVSAETEISATLTESSAEISAETTSKKEP